MIRGTTPTKHLLIEGQDLTGYRIYITVVGEQSGTKKTWTDQDDVVTVQVQEDGTHVYLELTQEETLEFGIEVATVQARWINDEGYAGASQTAQFTVGEVLLDEVITFEEG